MSVNILSSMFHKDCFSSFGDMMWFLSPLLLLTNNPICFLTTILDWPQSASLRRRRKKVELVGPMQHTITSVLPYQDISNQLCTGCSTMSRKAFMVNPWNMCGLEWVTLLFYSRSKITMATISLTQCKYPYTCITLTCLLPALYP